MHREKYIKKWLEKLNRKILYFLLFKKNYITIPKRYYQHRQSSGPRNRGDRGVRTYAPP